MKTTHTPAYVITNMPRHGDSIIAIAYNPTINSLQFNDLTQNIDALKNEDFVIANAAYQSICNFKINGLITEYAIAATTVEALRELNLRLPKNSLLKLGKQFSTSLSSNLFRLLANLFNRHSSHRIYP